MDHKKSQAHRLCNGEGNVGQRLWTEASSEVGGSVPVDGRLGGSMANRWRERKSNGVEAAQLCVVTVTWAWSLRVARSSLQDAGNPGFWLKFPYMLNIETLL